MKRETATALLWVTLLVLPLSGVAQTVNASSATTPLPRYWPLYRRAKTILRVVRPASQEEYITLMTLSGLVARAGQKGKTTERIWIDQQSPNAYALWFQGMLQQTGAKLKGTYTTSELIQRFRHAGIVKGYLLFHPDGSKRNSHDGVPGDTSANVATSLCAPLEGIAVADTSEAEYQQMGLERLLDARGVSEADCFAKYKTVFNRNVVGMQDPKLGETRDAVVAMQAFMVSQPGPVYEEALAWANPGSPILGWGIGDEFDTTVRATRHGLFITSTDWCTNLPLLSTEVAGRSFAASRITVPHPHSLWDLTWEDNVHYMTFVMSDGDNVQWLMGDFTQSNEHSWWDSSYRGKVEMGWTTCYDNLAQLSPYTLEHLFQTATPQDDFILFSGGYYYPDLFGSQRPGDDVLSRHAADIGAYMHLGGVKLLMFNLEKWDSPQGLKAYSVFAHTIPNLLGIFTINYAPYTAGAGKILWTPNREGGETPVCSLRFAIWNHANNPAMGDPTRVAGLLNAMPHKGEPNTDQFFSTVMIHAWSWFRAPHDGQPATEEQSQSGMPGTGRGICAAKWCADQLQPYVRILTPTEYIWMMRLRLHPQETLQAQLNQLSLGIHNFGKKPGRNPETLLQAEMEIRTAKEALKLGDFHAAFVHGKQANRFLQ